MLLFGKKDKRGRTENKVTKGTKGGPKRFLLHLKSQKKRQSWHQRRGRKIVEERDPKKRKGQKHRYAHSICPQMLWSKRKGEGGQTGVKKHTIKCICSYVVTDGDEGAVKENERIGVGKPKGVFDEVLNRGFGRGAGEIRRGR